MIATLSPTYRVTIPKDVREFLHLKPGMKFEITSSGGIIHCVPVRDVKSMRGAVLNGDK